LQEAHVQQAIQTPGFGVFRRTVEDGGERLTRGALVAVADGAGSGLQASHAGRVQAVQPHALSGHGSVVRGGGRHGDDASWPVGESECRWRHALKSDGSVRTCKNPATSL
jgi:hypothetical protein